MSECLIAPARPCADSHDGEWCENCLRSKFHVSHCPGCKAWEVWDGSSREVARMPADHPRAEVYAQVLADALNSESGTDVGLTP